MQDKIKEVTEEQKINKIYEVIADKSLSFGCLVSDKTFGFHHIITKKYSDYCDAIEITMSGQHRNCKLLIESNDGCDEIGEIFGHPVMINNVEYKLSKTDYNLIRSGLTKEEILKPVEEWNNKVINLLYEII